MNTTGPNGLSHEGGRTAKTWGLALPLFSLALVIWYMGRPLLGFHGLEVHNLITISTQHLTDLGRAFGSSYIPDDPSYRPLALLFYTLEGRLYGCNVTAFYLTNLVLLWGLAALTFVLARRGRGLWWPALLAALFLVTDLRLRQMQWLTVSHNLLSCITGYLAIHLLRSPSWARWDRAGVWLVGGLLLAAALFKEYGLAFAAGVFLAAWLWRPSRWQAVMVAAMVAVGVYFLMRWGLAGGATDGYDQVYGPKSLMGYLLNITATFINTLNGSIVRWDRVYNWPGYWDPVDFIILGLGLLGLVARPRALLPFLAIIAANSVLNFFAYRDRNQVVGMVALLVIFADGFGLTWEWLRRRGIGGAVAVGVLSLALIAGLWVDGTWLRNFFTEIAAKPPAAELAQAVENRQDISPAAVECALERYHRLNAR